ncbi:hypothetical protein [Roseibium polysiphoniae]|uniref:Class I SAM-dependent methyltransferase n=1 Tax=Roseibium polysiphoniae TaxID=2571221 RepID=A0ABR9C7Y1_9HYPH|nr:hypothetical protein [Roseibium polysiphoniae]MBD8876016.1 hypothetical protein [Roseibium polysiphoniae]
MKIDPEAADYILFQRTNFLPKKKSSTLNKLLSYFKPTETYEQYVQRYARNNAYTITERYAKEMEIAFDSIKGHIPIDAQNIMDIGCGIAALDYYLYQFLKANNPNIYLIDRTQVDENVWYMFEDRGSFYNSLDLAKQTLIANGVPEQSIFCIEAPDDGVLHSAINPCDLIISTYSWGFHYPIELYLESAYEILAVGGALIVDVRTETSGEELLNRKFGMESISVIYRGAKHNTLKCIKRM